MEPDPDHDARTKQMLWFQAGIHVAPSQPSNRVRWAHLASAPMQHCFGGFTNPDSPPPVSPLPLGSCLFVRWSVQSSTQAFIVGGCKNVGTRLAVAGSKVEVDGSHAASRASEFRVSLTRRDLHRRICKDAILARGEDCRVQSPTRKVSNQTYESVW